MKLYLPLLAITATLLAGDQKISRAPAPPPVLGPLPISLDASKWRIDYSPGVAPRPTQLATGGWYFNFPTFPKYVGYVTQTTSGYIPVCTSTTTTTLEADVVIATTGDPYFDFHTNPDNTGNMPSSARFYVEYHWSNEDFVRWWATGANCVVLAPGVYRYTVPIDPAYWSETSGHRGDSSPAAIAGFNLSFANIQRYGFTFGGGSFYGHGVGVTGGTAKFNLTGLRVVTVPKP